MVKLAPRAKCEVFEDTGARGLINQPNEQLNWFTSAEAAKRGPCAARLSASRESADGTSASKRLLSRVDRPQLARIMPDVAIGPIVSLSRRAVQLLLIKNRPEAVRVATLLLTNHVDARRMVDSDIEAGSMSSTPSK